MKAAVKQNIVQTFHDLNETFSLFSENEINKIPYENSWTAGQTAQHIVLAGSGYPELFAGKTEKTTRNPEEKVKDIEALFLNLEIKMDAPIFKKKKKKEYDKKVLIEKLHKIEFDLLDSAEKYDLTLTCLDFQVPGFDKFTIYEWINFVLIHTKRHTNQLNKISKSIKKI